MMMNFKKGDRVRYRKDSWAFANRIDGRTAVGEVIAGSYDLPGNQDKVDVRWAPGEPVDRGVSAHALELVGRPE
jgi:hypothetical protein